MIKNKHSYLCVAVHTHTHIKAQTVYIQMLVYQNAISLKDVELSISLSL